MQMLEENKEEISEQDFSSPTETGLARNDKNRDSRLRGNDEVG